MPHLLKEAPVGKHMFELFCFRPWRLNSDSGTPKPFGLNLRILSADRAKPFPFETLTSQTEAASLTKTLDSLNPKPLTPETLNP